jgi:hypothetical protein
MVAGRDRQVELCSGGSVPWDGDYSCSVDVFGETVPERVGRGAGEYDLNPRVAVEDVDDIENSRECGDIVRDQ